MYWSQINSIDLKKVLAWLQSQTLHLIPRAGGTEILTFEGEWGRSESAQRPQFIVCPQASSNYYYSVLLIWAVHVGKKQSISPGKQRYMSVSLKVE